VLPNPRAIQAFSEVEPLLTIKDKRPLFDEGVIVGVGVKVGVAVGLGLSNGWVGVILGVMV
jgi:hypothetical protein